MFRYIIGNVFQFENRRHVPSSVYIIISYISIYDTHRGTSLSASPACIKKAIQRDATANSLRRHTNVQNNPPAITGIGKKFDNATDI